MLDHPEKEKAAKQLFGEYCQVSEKAAVKELVAETGSSVLWFVLQSFWVSGGNALTEGILNAAYKPSMMLVLNSFFSCSC